MSSQRGGPQRGRGRGRGGPGGGSGGGGSDRPEGSGGSGGGSGFQGHRGSGRARGRGFGDRGGGPSRGPPQDPIFQPNVPATIDNRLSTVDDLAKTLSKLHIGPRMPARPGFGTLGTKTTVRSNFFAIKLPKGPFYDYSVEITPKTDMKRHKARIFQILESEQAFVSYTNHIVHDSSERLVSARELPQPLDIQLPFSWEGEAPSQDPKIYQVSVRFMRKLDLTEITRYTEGKGPSNYDFLPVTSALNLIVQQRASRNGPRVGQNRYFEKSSAEIQKLNTGLQAWKGFFTSVRPVYKTMMVNVNVCFAAFYEPGNMGDAIATFRRESRGAMPQKFAQGIKITTFYTGHKMKKPLKKIMDKNAKQQKFRQDDPSKSGGGRETSVEDYFRKTWNITLKHPEWPVVNIGGKNSQANYIPAELCIIEEGQPYHGRLDPNSTRNMIRIAVNRPAVNATSIVQQGLPTLGYTKPIQSPMDAFGIEISSEMATVPARILPPPRISYAQGNPRVMGGSWNILDVKFKRGMKVGGFWVLEIADGPPPRNYNQGDLLNLVKGFTAKCIKSGMVMPGGNPRWLTTPPLEPIFNDPNRIRATNMVRETLEEAKKKGGGKPDFILVLLRNTDDYIYPNLKRIGEVTMGLQTVCMQLDKALGDPRKQDQYFSNVALKLNTKLGGVNHVLSPDDMRWLTKQPTISIGIDVTHPGPSSVKGTPSIVAVVGSVDQDFVQYPCSLRIQESKKEMVTELSDMVVERLLLWKKLNKALPRRIFVFRDGVSEGQFEDVLNKELTEVQKAVQKMNTKDLKEPFKPKITVFVCGKRHHARFYPTNGPDADKNGNTKPGTVVDQGVTSVWNFDFYLQPHSGLQGTVRPTHYTVVYDENNLGADEVQQGIHTKSYSYGRATKAVSLVPPAYYADLACERGRCYLNEFLNLGDDASSVAPSTTGSSSRPPRFQGIERKREEERKMAQVFAKAKEHWGAGLHPSLSEKMFYI